MIWFFCMGMLRIWGVFEVIFIICKIFGFVLLFFKDVVLMVIIFFLVLMSIFKFVSCEFIMMIFYLFCFGVYIFSFLVGVLIR